MGKGRICGIDSSISELSSPDFNQLLSCDIIESIQSIVTTMLQRVSVFDLKFSIVVDFFLNHFFFSQLDLFLPTSQAIKFLIIFTKVKAPVIETFVKIFNRKFLTNFLELHSASD